MNIRNNAKENSAGITIKNLLIKHKLTQEKMAESIGLTQGHLSSLISGRYRPSVKIMMRLVKKFRASKKKLRPDLYE